MNALEYVRNSPAHRIDPSGTWGIPFFPPSLTPLFGPRDSSTIRDVQPPINPLRQFGNIKRGLVPRPREMKPVMDPVPFEEWLPGHDLKSTDRPVQFGCGGVVGIYADWDPPIHFKPGTKCTTVYEDALKCLAAEQRKNRWPLLVAVQTNTPIAIRATEGCCDVNGMDLGNAFSNYLCMLGEDKWHCFWIGASAPPRKPDACVKYENDPFGKAQTWFCIVQNPHNWSPDFRAILSPERKK